MDVIKLKSKSEQVRLLQLLLNKNGESLVADGDAGQKTVDAIKRFQEKNKLTADGIAGKATWNKLLESFNKESLTDKDFEEAAKLIGCEPACIKAVKEVETGSVGAFLSNNMPTILFEGHIFWSQLKKAGIDPKKYEKEYSDVLYEKWTKSKYKSGIKEYDRLEKAKKINVTCALNSASWGFCQIMGFNYKLCEFKTTRDYINNMYDSQKAQLIAFVNFIKNSGLDKHLIKKDWAAFAKGYNGSAYAKNQYDVKLKNAYEKYKK